MRGQHNGALCWDAVEDGVICRIVQYADPLQITRFSTPTHPSFSIYNSSPLSSSFAMTRRKKPFGSHQKNWHLVARRIRNSWQNSRRRWHCWLSPNWRRLIAFEDQQQMKTAMWKLFQRHQHQHLQQPNHLQHGQHSAASCARNTERLSQRS